MNNIDESIKLLALFERANLSSVSEFEKILIESLERILGKLAGLPSDISRQRLNAIKKEITDIIDRDFEKLPELIGIDKEEWAALAYDTQAAALTTLPTVASSRFATIPQTAIKKILDPNTLVMGITEKESIQELANINKRIVPIIANGVATGVPNDEITREIRATYDTLARRHVDNAVRQIVNSAMARATDEVIEQVGQNVVTRAMFEATIDGRTTPYCANSNGKEWVRKKDESYADFRNRVLTTPLNGRPPNVPCCVHYGCRSRILWTTPEFIKAYKEGTRKAVLHDKKTVRHRDGSTSTKFKVAEVQEIPATKTWMKWFDENAEEKYQRDYLGPKKYKLYKDGGMSVEKLLVPRENRILTIEEIKSRFL